MCEFLKITVVDLLQIAIGAATLLIAWKVYRKLIPGELKKMQLEAVLELVRHLNQYSFDVIRYRNAGINFQQETGVENRNIFNYRNIFKNDSNFKKFKKLQVCLLSDNNHPFEVSEFIENPLLPKSIVAKLSWFISPFIHNGESASIKANDDIVLFIPKDRKPYDGELMAQQLYLPKGVIYKEHYKLVQAIEGLIVEIEKWCKENGLKDLNFREVESQKID